MARIVFIGTPQFASTCLSMLLKEHDVIGVVTQPNRPSGRGRKLRPLPHGRNFGPCGF